MRFFSSLSCQEHDVRVNFVCQALRLISVVALNGSLHLCSSQTHTFPFPKGRHGLPSEFVVPDMAVADTVLNCAKISNATISTAMVQGVLQAKCPEDESSRKQH